MRHAFATAWGQNNEPNAYDIMQAVSGLITTMKIRHDATARRVEFAPKTHAALGFPATYQGLVAEQGRPSTGYPDYVLVIGES